VFGDLNWPLNASRGFVSISWASCSVAGYAIGIVGSDLYFNLIENSLRHWSGYCLS